ncbi:MULTISPECIES: CsgG/HfaB family protein [unclassified Shewanella]|uniref:CsgG/HfaB family protein n=1 Tax=unclassified Shewanella TaxID=196818 RepID=UPI000970FA57|nr:MULTISPECIES: CsgG/HfaB family protein [unclassified Shewanella]MDO6618186.1 CsgG/HfaB family protein [Shewanella sp. 6_MG-2023]MDO6638458.1 CsgG/HfaB family protein [Shewanella sp. 5_MG-2023]MDO6677366.1 CsgG/HfaB family protein [Shewanella sp. 4_MG-2023]MDO6774281.1 CsgG/HfaB family protein [Shewanella sp. 3_MG-2023]PMG41385.1 curli production assembly/transport protein CsgG [Shewanella sp. 10N.286.52.B9]
MKKLIISLCLLSLTACSSIDEEFENIDATSSLMPKGETYYDLTSLPFPQGAMVAAVYDFRDQTGQYKPIPSSNFSTAVPQSGTAFLAQSLNDSAWFIPVEREGLQNLLTERKILRAGLKGDASKLPQLNSAQVLMEGGIVAYDTNIKTGGAGARYLGIGASGQYRVDSITVNLRAVDIRTGRLLSSVTTTKSVISKEITAGVFKFIDAQDLLEAEAGYTSNEPVSLCVVAAIESAVVHLIADGIWKGAWRLGDATTGLQNTTLQKYWLEAHKEAQVSARIKRG